jgi:hypothetical protein
MGVISLGVIPAGFIPVCVISVDVIPVGFIPVWSLGVVPGGHIIHGGRNAATPGEVRFQPENKTGVIKFYALVHHVKSRTY